MTSIKSLSAVFATVATTVAALCTLGANSAQAAIITGSISGAWVNGGGFDAYTQGPINLGDPFTVTYSYDDTIFRNQHSGSATDYHLSTYTSPLLSLALTSGTYSHSFDFANGGSGSLYFQDYALAAPTYTPYSSLFIQLDAFDPTATGNNVFTANRNRGQNNGVPSCMILFEYTPWTLVQALVLYTPRPIPASTSRLT